MSGTSTKQSWQDTECSCVTIDPASGLLRIDGLPICKVIIIGQQVYLQFKDSNRLRSKYRETDLIEVPLIELVDKIIKSST